MDTTETTTSDGAPAGASSYDLLVGRLRETGAALRAAAATLNDQRAEVFAARPMTLAEAERFRTETPSTPTDLVVIGDLALLAHDPVVSGKRSVSDLFTLYRLERVGDADWDVLPLAPGSPGWFLADPSFGRDFEELVTYYADARVRALQLVDDTLLMVFRIGDELSDVRVLRWRLADGTAHYLDAYGELAPDAPDDVDWRTVGREAITAGRAPVLDLDGLVMLDLEGGELVARVPDPVSGPRVVHREPVDEPGQDLAELRVRTARVGDLLVIGLTPYREPHERFYVYNRLTGALTRDDGLAGGVRTLPGGQGVVFPGGYHLGNGEAHTYLEAAAGTWRFHQRIVAPNGEDVLYAYDDPAGRRYLLCGYNQVTKTMANPVPAAGYGRYADGTMLVLREAREGTRVHSVGIYTSPYCDPDVYEPPVPTASFFGRVGNPELVAVLGECFALARDVERPGFNEAGFEAITVRCRSLLDTYPWFADPEATALGEQVRRLGKTAGQILDEFAAVTAARKAAHEAVQQAAAEVAAYRADAGIELRDTAAFIDRLTAGSVLLGRLGGLAEQPYVDAEAVAALRADATDLQGALAERTLEFLTRDDALVPLADEIAAAEADAGRAPTAQQAAASGTRIDEVGQRVVVLTDVVGGLEAVDAPTKTGVLAALADLLARRNAATAAVASRVDALRTTEAGAEFAAAMAVLTQRASAAAASAADPGSVDAALATLEAECETLDARFGDVAEFSAAVADKRDEIYGALDDTARGARVRAGRPGRSSRAGRPAGARRRRRPGVPQCRPRRVRDVLRHRFPGREGRPHGRRVARAGRGRPGRRARGGPRRHAGDGPARRGRPRRPVRRRRQRPHRAAPLRRQHHAVRPAPDADRARGWARAAAHRHRSRRPAAGRRGGGHRAGGDPGPPVRDADDAASGLPRLRAAGGRPDRRRRPRRGAAPARRRLLARHPRRRRRPAARGHGRGVALTGAVDRRDGPRRRCRVAAGTGRRRPTGARPAARRRPSPGRGAGPPAARRRARPRRRVVGRRRGPRGGRRCGRGSVDGAAAAGYLVDHGERLAVSTQADTLATAVVRWARASGVELKGASLGDIAAYVGDVVPPSADGEAPLPAGRLDEAALAVRHAGQLAAPVAADLRVTVSGLLSTHPRIRGGTLVLDVDVASSAYRRYVADGLPRFREAAAARRHFLQGKRVELGVDGLKATPIGSFVRNALIDDVYLPLIGANLAKQLGRDGAAQGALMLISPPGYGKTTLVEYVVGLMGFALVKINGPALGQGVTSLDPAAAPDAAAAAELVKLNQAFAMGNNVVCYLDDIQHTSQELLSRFIPLCDATRRIEGVWRGEPRTYELAGRRFAIVLAGNPYTGSGERFELPDMLVNRSDVHNLGDVVAGRADLFARSYLEVAAGSNPTLAPVVLGDRGDLDVFLRATQGEPVEARALSRPYPAADVRAVTAVLAHLVRARDRLLLVNEAYIRSATLDDGLRGEPPFLLQGSYRNMAKLAARIVPAMTADEVEGVLADHYRTEAQTLADAAAWNLARLAELIDPDSPAAAEASTLRARWAEERAAANPALAVTRALAGIEDALRADGDVG